MQFATSFTAQIIIPTLSWYVVEQDMSVMVLGTLSSVFSIGTTLSFIIAGPVMRNTSTRSQVVALFGVRMVVSALLVPAATSRSTTLLAAIQLANGLSAATSLSAINWVGREMHVHERAFGIVLMQICIQLGLAIGPVAAVHMLAWSSPLMAIASGGTVLNAIAAISSVRNIPDTVAPMTQSHPTRFVRRDYLPVVVSFLGCASILPFGASLNILLWNTYSIDVTRSGATWLVSGVSSMATLIVAQRVITPQTVSTVTKTCAFTSAAFTVAITINPYTSLLEFHIWLFVMVAILTLTHTVNLVSISVAYSGNTQFVVNWTAQIACQVGRVIFSPVYTSLFKYIDKPAYASEIIVGVLLTVVSFTLYASSRDSGEILY